MFLCRARVIKKECNSLILLIFYEHEVIESCNQLYKRDGTLLQVLQRNLTAKSLKIMFEYSSATAIKKRGIANMQAFVSKL